MTSRSRDRILVDTSAVAAMILAEPSRDRILEITRGVDVLAAAVLGWEMGNALVAGHRKGRLSAQQIHEAGASFRALPLRLLDVDIGRSIGLALELGVYAYDAYVLHAARISGARLLTLDRRMEEVAGGMGIPVIEVMK